MTAENSGVGREAGGRGGGRGGERVGRLCGVTHVADDMRGVYRAFQHARQRHVKVKACHST
eukprot:2813937-Rhodomonas_salina.1